MANEQQTREQTPNRQSELTRAKQQARLIDANQTMTQGFGQSQLMNDATKGEVLKRRQQMGRINRAQQQVAQGKKHNALLNLASLKMMNASEQPPEEDDFRESATRQAKLRDEGWDESEEDENEEENQDEQDAFTEESEGEENESTQEAGGEQADNQGSKGSRLSLAKAKARMGEAEQKKRREMQKKFEQELKKKAKAALTRGIVWLTNLVAGALDISSGTISMIVDIFVYILTFGWLNVQLFYGTYLTRGKSKYVSPLEWDPIPPILPNTYLHGIILGIDILIILVALISITTTIVLIAFAVQLVQHPIETLIANPDIGSWLSDSNLSL